MKKELFIFLSASFVLLLIAGVYAAGPSSGNSNQNSQNNTQTNRQTNQTQSPVNCETFTTIKERIKCRFENKGNLVDNPNYQEEACRNNAKAAVCVQLYKDAKPCYELSSAPEKKACFLTKSGISQRGALSAAPNEKKRNYIVLLLYELQERIESTEAQAQITTEEAANLVALIVEIKQDIFAEKPRSEIVPKVQNLKQEYFEAIQ